MQVSPALYNWRRTDGGMDTDAAKELHEQNARPKRVLAGAELEKDALREVAKDGPVMGCGRTSPMRSHAIAMPIMVFG
ncbi:hypothetical protein KUF57_25470 [Mycolicibacterium sp. PAM1]|uniref:hypothetical protein n=1 Tax=Mycolicibacterium sp. PAM1 TaxID=2853535 RepID=UPI001C3C4DCC|nr:hypothetical protein [Mycolicibacterium sp. PAM1]MBV5246884.1 hypothetical protein [Mycolicibacterium sp. PAM1]